MNYISICSQADEHYARVQELEKQVEHYKNKAEYLDKRELELLKQAKPLSYEEIAEIWKKEWQGGNIGHIAYTYARAIEERHGIK